MYPLVDNQLVSKELQNLVNSSALRRQRSTRDIELEALSLSYPEYVVYDRSKELITLEFKEFFAVIVALPESYEIQIYKRPSVSCAYQKRYSDLKQSLDAIGCWVCEMRNPKL